MLKFAISIISQSLDICGTGWAEILDTQAEILECVSSSSAIDT